MTSPVSSRSGFGNVNTTRNIRAVQLLLGHNKLESTVRYLGIEVDDALENLGTNRGVTLLMHACDRRRSLSDPEAAARRSPKADIRRYGFRLCAAPVLLALLH